MTSRMLGSWCRPWCPVCRTSAGPDCPNVSPTKRQQRAQEKRAWMKEAA